MELGFEIGENLVNEVIVAKINNPVSQIELGDVLVAVESTNVLYKSFSYGENLVRE